MNPTTDPALNSTTVDLAAQPAGAVPKPLSIRVIGVGGAGGNAISHMAQSDLRELRLIALHTNARILNMTQAPEKVLIGAERMHGLGAGGDPSLARAAAEHDLDLLKTLCQDADLLFIVTGLGGGTGTGVAPVVARVAKECGALVLGVATLPFELEGVRRRHHADQGLQELKAAADAVICLPNQKIFRVVDENTTVLESLKITNDLLAQGIRGVWQMLTRPGLIHVDFADLCSLLRDRHAESTFASVQAQGEGRAREVIEQLLACPLLEGSEALGEAESLLVNLVGGPDLSMADIKRIMDEINRRTDNAHLIMGASVAENLQGRISLTLIASRRPAARAPEMVPGEHAVHPATVPIPVAPPDFERRANRPNTPTITGPRFTPVSPDSGTTEKADEKTPRQPAQAQSRSGRPSFRLQQGHLPLEIVSKGRFEKSHPTILGGEDLDLPTYVRRGIPLN